MKFKRLWSVLQSHSPDTLLDGLPLLYWALKKPKCVALLLRVGANPDIHCRVDNDLCVSPLYSVEFHLRAAKSKAKQKIVCDILKYYGAHSIRYSDFCVVDIHLSGYREIVL